MVKPRDSDTSTARKTRRPACTEPEGLHSICGAQTIKSFGGRNGDGICLKVTRLRTSTRVQYHCGTKNIEGSVRDVFDCEYT